MCFSAEASFVVGGALIPVGAYCVQAALRKRPGYLGLATVPLLFGIQQISEGFVWLGLAREDETLVRNASLFFLLFALAAWPFWFPLQAAIMETQPSRRRILFGIALLSTVWFFILFLPILRNPAEMLATRVVGHSIVYEYPNLPVYRYLSILPLRLLYFATVAAPFVVSSEKWGVLPGVALLLSAVVAAVAFHYAYVSVWCFFAAVLAGFVCVIFHGLPAPAQPIAQPAENS